MIIRGDANVHQGVERHDFDRSRAALYVNTDVFIVAFSIDDPSTFANVKAMWVPELKAVWPSGSKLLVGVNPEKRKDPSIVAGISYVTKKRVSSSYEHLMNT